MAEAMDNTDAVVSCNNHCSNDVKMTETNDESSTIKKKLDNAVEMKDSNNGLLDTSVQDHSMNLGLFKKDDSGIDMDKSPTSSSSAKDSGVEKSPASIKDCSLLSDLDMSECINESQTDSGATSRTNSVSESSKICDKISSGLSERNCNGNKEEEKRDGTDVKNDRENKEVKDAEELENDKTGEEDGSEELSYMPVSLDTEDSDPTGSYDITMPSTLDSDDEEENPAVTFIKVNKNLRGKRKFRIPKMDSDSDTESEDERVTATANVQSRTNKDLDSDDFSDDDVEDKKSSENKSESEEEEETDTDDVKPKHIWKALYDLRGREYGHSNRTPPAVFREKVQGSLQMVQRLKLQYKMECHDGCVNALHFNRIGTLLASGSDDLNVVLWNWVKNRPSLVYDSGHRSNVFQAKFMPFSGDCHVVSCARDGQVRLAELSLTGVCKNTKKLAQHKGAAHKLALELDSPHVFLSCGEDAMVYEIDLRQEKPNKLCQTKENDRKVPLYSIHSNPVNSFEFCVGGRDHFVRVYDKRKIANEENGGLLKKFCPHHLVDSNSKANVTCAVYNFNGTEILGSYNDDDIYLFDNLHSDGADFIKRYKGHRNNATVKGVNFFGPRSEFVVSGSDCGHIYLWDKETEQVVQFMEGDEGGVINVLEPHPFAPVLATSGLDHDVKVWAPTAEEPTKLQELKRTAKKNKKERDEDRSSEPRGLEEMIDGPMLYYLMRQIHRARRRNDPRGDHSSSNESSDSDSDESDDEVDRLQCAQS